MKISGGMTENGVVVGNAYDKYDSRNPIVRFIMKGFEYALSDLVEKAAPSSIHEIGCGEGYWVIDWNTKGIAARGSDFSEKVIRLARENANNSGLSPNLFSIRSIYDIEPGQDSADLIVCCEVLEHLENPEAGLSALQRVASEYVILSVPREPIWCVFNLARGKYLSKFGNTPGHIQHWSTKKFVDLAGSFFKVVERRVPLPWTILLCRRK